MEGGAEQGTQWRTSLGGSNMGLKSSRVGGDPNGE